MSNGVTVIIPAYGPGPHLEEVVASLDRQLDDASTIIISHSGTDDPTDRFAANSRVTVLHSKERLFAGAARNRALALAKTEWVAFVDEDVVPAHDWHSALRRAISSDEADCVIGAIGYRVTGGYWGMAIWYVEFGSVHPYLGKRPLTGGPSANMAVRREPFAKAGGFPQDWRFAQDIVAHARMVEAGQPVMFEPTLIVYHYNRGGIGHMWRHMFHHGRYSARVRRDYPKLPAAAAVRWPLLSVGMLPARMVQVIRRVFGSPNSDKGQFLLYLPGIFVGTAAFSLGFAREAMRPRLQPSDLG
jgi:GT2 family glycosyltransferase